MTDRVQGYVSAIDEGLHLICRQESQAVGTRNQDGLSVIDARGL